MTQADHQVPNEWLDSLEELVRKAGQAIMEVYNAQGELEIETKQDDSPLTAADRASHQIIGAGLVALTPDIPVLSEESEAPAFEVRARWRRFWLVDPLDGTKEFIGRNGEFTVNIALIEGQVPVLGLVYVPVQQVLYMGMQGVGAWRKDAAGKRRIQCRPLPTQEPVRVVASRRHGADELGPLLREAEKVFAGINSVSVGSSLKICMLAEGRADWYPRLALTSEWDTAAAQAVLEAAGGAVLDTELQPLRYNTKESLLNPFFHAIADPSFEWQRVLRPAGSARK